MISKHSGSGYTFLAILGNKIRLFYIPANVAKSWGLNAQNLVYFNPVSGRN